MFRIVQRSSLLKIAVILSLLGCIHSDASATWNLIKQMNTPIDCGFFFDEMNGFVGSGLRRTFTKTAQIFHTTDGGTTWSAAQVPFTRGAITSIYMLNKLTGYASVFSMSETLWKTIDGGATWTSEPIPVGSGICVFATPSAVVLTNWIYPGGVSFDGGATFNQTFADRQLFMSNGVDFADDLHGAVTIGPHGNNQGANSYSTSDGGVTWTKGYNLPEAWGVYALKGTQTYFAAAEGSAADPQNYIYQSTDNGITWQILYTFPDPFLRFTGHIAGKNTRIYAQTDATYPDGLYRSDDLGQSWNQVGGPANSRDTRFVVTGCSGEVVYAFDETGGIYKTTDGGDGTLGTIGSPLSVSIDTLHFPTSYCRATQNVFTLINQSCASTIIDSSVITQDRGQTYRILRHAADSIIVLQSDSESLTYTPNLSEGDTSLLTIYAHQGNQIIVKRIVLAGHNFTAPTPFLAPIPSTSAGDNDSIAVYLVPTKDPFSMSSLSLHLGFNGDVFTPIGITTTGTLTNGATSAKWTPQGNNGVNIAVTLPKPLDRTFDLTKPLIYVKMRVTLSDSLATVVQLDSFAINGPTPLALCANPEVRFTEIPKCGDSTISLSMSKQLQIRWLTVAPNPASGGKVTLRFYLDEASSLEIDLFDQATALAVAPIVSTFSKGEHSVDLDTHALRAGSYFVTVRSQSGGMLSQKLIELR